MGVQLRRSRSVARLVGRPRGGGGGRGNRREDAKEASESGLGERGPTDRCNKGLERGTGGLAGCRVQTWTCSDREGALVHTRTDCAALSTATHAKKREGRQEE